MPETRLIAERELGVLAKQYREQAGMTRAQAARDMNVSQTTIFHAEESPAQSLLKVRVRMIELYSPFRVKGPLYQLEQQSTF